MKPAIALRFCRRTVFRRMIVLLGLCVVSSAFAGERLQEDKSPISQKVDLSEGFIAGLSGHWAASVDYIAWSPDGTRVATAPWGPFITIRNVDTGEASAVLFGHKGEVIDLAWSPDGAYLATAAESDPARLWDARTGSLIVEFDGGLPDDSAVAWSPNGSKVAATMAGGVALWSVTENIGEFFPATYSTAQALAWSPSGKHLALASTDYATSDPGFDILVFDPETGEQTNVLKGFDDTILSLAWAQNGEFLAGGSQDRTARVWNIVTGELVLEIADFEDDAERGIAWSPDSQKIAFVLGTNDVRVVDVPSGKTAAELACGSPDYVCVNVAWSPDGGAIAAAGDDGGLRLWETESFGQTYSRVDENNWIGALEWSPDGGRLAAGYSDDALRIWDRKSQETTLTVRGQAKPVDRVAWSPVSSRAAMALEDGRIIVWDETSGKLVDELTGHEAEIRVLAWSPDGSLLVSADREEVNIVWDMATGRKLVALNGHTNDILTLSWSPDSTQIATGSWDETARVWDARTGSQVWLLEGHQDTVRSVAWSPDGARIATGGDDSLVRVFDARTGAEISQSAIHEDSVENLAWSPEGDLLASASEDGTVRIWDEKAGEEKSAFCCTVDNSTQLAWSPDGSRLASSMRARVVIWDRESGDVLTTETSFSHYPQFLVWSPDGKFIAAGSEFAPARVHGTRHGWWVREFNRDQRTFNWLDWGGPEGAIVVGDGAGLVESHDLFEGRRKAFLIGQESGWVSCDWPASTCLRADHGMLLQSVEKDGLKRIPMPD
ncbi:translocation protein TolB [Labrenzia sp. THAF82]|uniref:WD40 domain-containing protein n=1 Tax=Labrenzia sp. THAF82 TaxID=2587861 RepID=UPI0012A91438|nr:WD40 repeat domain-containing protein [Labrenzia sp. THAF82]QFT30560.1 translocation protein TolB [Labrenzia sp. THAF82]